MGGRPPMSGQGGGDNQAGGPPDGGAGGPGFGGGGAPAFHHQRRAVKMADGVGAADGRGDQGVDPLAKAVEALHRLGQPVLAAPDQKGRSGAEQHRHQGQRPGEQGEGEQEQRRKRHVGESGQIGGAQRLLGALDAAHQFGTFTGRPPLEGVYPGGEHQPEHPDRQPLVSVADDFLGQMQTQPAKEIFGANGDGHPGGQASQGAADAVTDIAVQHLDDIERRHQPEQIDHQRSQQQIGRGRPVSDHPREEFGHGAPSRLSWRRGGAGATWREPRSRRSRRPAAASTRCHWPGSAPRCATSPRRPPDSRHCPS